MKTRKAARGGGRPAIEDLTPEQRKSLYRAFTQSIIPTRIYSEIFDISVERVWANLRREARRRGETIGKMTYVGVKTLERATSLSTGALHEYALAAVEGKRLPMELLR